jgi:hypothetical protein
VESAVTNLDLTEAIEAARRVLGWGDTSAEMDRAIPKLAEIVARHVERQVRDRIFADIQGLTFDQRCGQFYDAVQRKVRGRS